MRSIHTLFFIAISITFSSFSQIKKEKTNGIFYKISLATTLTINEDYVAFDEDDSSTLLEPSALFVNNTIGYKFDQRTMIGLNFEYNWHSKQGLHFFPTYLNLQHNVILDDTSLFVRGGYGTLLGVGKSFEKGNMYKVGLGIEMVDINNAILLGLDFSRKRFGNKNIEGISSVTIFLEFMLF
ncbi:hypothetical protein ACFSKN_13045 [Mariniflexile gromovii]|uniref:Outer membrane protein with beta-barrel domain n=1 Tax=Mariniflexile gromovii TaxID=362523 RepID=A0ABS4BW29_9FLAO|nr:hypothetical protein [Mariniflexile gromovii]MBP0904789.1 hypothetical protein [Mariniflexile gromovii]